MSRLLSAKVLLEFTHCPTEQTVSSAPAFGKTEGVKEEEKTRWKNFFSLRPLFSLLSSSSSASFLAGNFLFLLLLLLLLLLQLRWGGRFVRYPLYLLACYSVLPHKRYGLEERSKCLAFFSVTGCSLFSHIYIFLTTRTATPSCWSVVQEENKESVGKKKFKILRCVLQEEESVSSRDPTFCALFPLLFDCRQL